MQGVMIFRWSAAKEGREVEAMKFADDADAMYARLEDEGRVAAHEWCANFTGNDDDMFIVRGEPDALGAVAMSPEFGAMMNKGRLYLEDFHWDMGVSGTRIDEVYPGWRQLVGA